MWFTLRAPNPSHLNPIGGKAASTGGLYRKRGQPFPMDAAAPFQTRAFTEACRGRSGGFAVSKRLPELTLKSVNLQSDCRRVWLFQLVPKGCSMVLFLIHAYFVK
ncbi:hypothetical protein A0256_04090 [Mucilaginibacter sp. PAMC 26640]|nr:hypothetical protein A0256_04090 [Mucilaginibacter sp. PAMC 26640]